MTQLIWLRRDLRVSDNTALSAAMAAGPTIALFLLTPGQWRIHDDAPCKVDFWLRNLAELATELRRLNVPLLIRHADDWQTVPAALRQVCHEHAVRAVHFNDDYGVDEQRRDHTVSEALHQDGIVTQRYLDRLLFAPGSRC